MLNATIECTGSLTIGKKTKNIATKIIVIGIKVKTYGKIHTYHVYIVNIQLVGFYSCTYQLIMKATAKMNSSL